MTLTGNQIRQKFIDYFVSKGHEAVASASLVPQNDPTLYFTNAGMVQFKNLFTGEEKRGCKRAATSQKCMRVSGKHNDLENVGRTEIHHTFFEMLGNFSFGDYFKSEAIAFAWEFLTQEMKLPREKLWITVFEKDDEAADLWNREQGIPKERIIRKGAADNFWAMGDTGPCGPCSEIHIEKDFAVNFTKSSLKKFDDNKVMEIWNLVFMQFERSADGKLIPLPKPSIDTGMGLERLATVIQRMHSNYETDLFRPIIKKIEDVTGIQYTRINSDNDISIRVIADHIRATAFLISDGVLPSNEGRGYVLRRIMRRAIRHGKLLGQTGPFFHRVVDVVVREMGEAYPDLKRNQSTIEKIVLAEEERFFETLETGLKILMTEMKDSRKHNNNKIIRGETAFKLYDTFGFPLDLTQVIASECGFAVDEIDFDKCMTEQKERARAAWKGSGQARVNELYLELADSHESKFLGCDTLEAPAKVVALIQNGVPVKSVTGGEFEIIFDQTPCYGEGGGQAGDKAHGTANNLRFEITNTTKPVPALFVHSAKINSGNIAIGQAVQLSVNRLTRRPTMRNHSATHLLHAALRKILGKHVRQAGSLVNERGLRFDFSHFEAIAPEMLKQIEDEVNKAILADMPVSKQEKSHDEAVSAGALAFFGDKYGDKVRVVSMGDYSVELCGGTHLNHTSEIGFFKITSESSIAAGVRRIEAVTGMEAVHLAQEDSRLMKHLASQLKTSPGELPDKVEKLSAQIKTLEKEIETIKMKMLRGNTEDLLKNSIEVNGVKIVIHHTQTDNAKVLQELSDVILDKLKSGIAVVSAEMQGKLSLVVSVTKDLESRYPANKILQPLAEAIGGKGGGRPSRAQAGGTDVNGVQKFAGILQVALK